ncbi:hypothetical protein D3C80_1453760 [compost metagenome]
MLSPGLKSVAVCCSNVIAVVTVIGGSYLNPTGSVSTGVSALPSAGFLLLPLLVELHAEINNVMDSTAANRADNRPVLRNSLSFIPSSSPYCWLTGINYCFAAII